MTTGAAKRRLSIFLSTPSARRATLDHAAPPSAFLIFLSTPSARRATFCRCLLRSDPDISIHALREEGDVTGNGQEGELLIFLSTPSARRATLARRAEKISARNFYPRPPRGGRLPTLSQEWMKEGISIHALREEGDASSTGRIATCVTFLSTPSARRATTTP